MMFGLHSFRWRVLIPLFILLSPGHSEDRVEIQKDRTLSQLVHALKAKVSSLESASGMKTGFQAFLAVHGLKRTELRYSDYVMVRLLFEATRDAGFWNLHWKITNQSPHSDRIWRQWKNVSRPSASAPTAIAECDELSALFAFLARSFGIKRVGLFWPTSNHTVAVWVISFPKGPAVRVVVPTTQIFLSERDYFGTKRFDPWKQKHVFEYARRDVPQSFALPAPLLDFFLKQAGKYAGATDQTLQNLRYLREGVLCGVLSSEQAARQARAMEFALGSSACPEDLAAYRHFARDMGFPCTP